MDFENDSGYITPDSGYISPENTTLEKQNETSYEEAGTILPEVSRVGEWSGGCEASRILPEVVEQDC